MTVTTVTSSRVRVCAPARPLAKKLRELLENFLTSNCQSGTNSACAGSNGDGPEAEPPGTPTGGLRVLSSPVGDRHGLPLDDVWRAAYGGTGQIGREAS